MTIPSDFATVFGVVSVGGMMVFYAMEARGRGFVLAFACACVLSAIYGFIAGVWPFGVVEMMWAGVAARRWWSRAST